MDTVKSYDVVEYGVKHENRDAFSVIKQIIDDRERESPAIGIVVGFTGNLIKLTYHSYEMAYPLNKKAVDAKAWDTLKSVVSYLKKEFKKRTKKTLDLKEKKELESQAAQKVSMNERYYVIFTRYYEISWK